MSKEPRDKKLRRLNRQVGRVHFDDFSPQNFERLVFAFVLRTGRSDAEWIGQGGGDGGRDVWSEGNGRPSAVFVCANYKVLTFAKVCSDLRSMMTSRFVSEDIGLSEEDISPEATLSAEADKLLRAMARVSDGSLLRSETHDGYSLSVGGEDVQPPTNERRVVARWQKAVKELLGQELIEEEGPSGDIFSITAAGYAIADKKASEDSGTKMDKVISFQPIKMSNPLIFFQNVEKMIPEAPFSRAPLQIEIPSRPAVCLRIYPAKSIPPLRSALAARDLASQGMLRPMGLKLGGADWVRNAKGGLVYAGPFEGKLTNFTQLFLSGEICGVDARISTRMHIARENGDFKGHVVMAYETELSCVLTLRDFLRFYLERRFDETAR